MNKDEIQDKAQTVRVAVVLSPQELRDFMRVQAELAQIDARYIERLCQVAKQNQMRSEP